MAVKCIAFDCFGTVFDMSGVSKDEIRSYVDHVRQEKFTPFEFPASWWKIEAHKDSAEGIKRLHAAGFWCVTLSNGSRRLLEFVSHRNDIYWKHIIDLVSAQVYKPHIGAYKTVETLCGFKPCETLMVTANPTFGDIEGAAAIGMQSQVIRQPGTPQTIIELAESLAVKSG